MSILQVNSPVRLTLSISGINPTYEGFATYSYFKDKDRILLYQYVDLNTYPSASDFYGDSYPIPLGEIGTILSYVGRPKRISRDPRWCKFDLYDVLLSGKIVQVFRQNLEPISLSE